MMKICMITHNYTRFKGDNVAPFIRYIVTNLRKLGNDIVVLAAYDEEFDMEFLKKDNAFLFKYAFPSKFHIKYGRALIGDKKLNIRGLIFGPFYLLSGFFWLLRLHSRSRFDIINAHWVIPNGIIGALFARLFHIPLVISLHGSGIYLGQKNFVFRALSRYVFRSANGVTACSPVLRDGALDLRAKPETTEVVPYGVDLKTFFPEDNNSPALKSRLGIDPDDKVILALGRMVEKKGFEFLLRAVPGVVKEVKACRFVLAGDGPIIKELKILSKELGIEKFVLFPGAIPWKDIPRYHKMCDISVIPSIVDSQGNVDGLPNVILESMASGKPIVASRIAGIPLAVKDGENGILVEEKNVTEITKALVRLLCSSELRKRMGKESRSRVERELNWERTASQFLKVYLKAKGHNKVLKR